MVTFEEFKKLEMRVGKIVSAAKIADSEKLVKLDVSFGEFGTKQIIAGIAPYFQNPADIIGKKFAFAFNIEPRTIKGLESQGMILAAGDASGFSLLNVGPEVLEGSLIK